MKPDFAGFTYAQLIQFIDDQQVLIFEKNERIERLKKFLSIERHDILKAIRVLDGNSTPVDWRIEGTELQRKLAEHLEAMAETEQQLEERIKELELDLELLSNDMQEQGER